MIDEEWPAASAKLAALVSLPAGVPVINDEEGFLQGRLRRDILVEDMRLSACKAWSGRGLTGTGHYDSRSNISIHRDEEGKGER